MTQQPCYQAQVVNTFPTAEGVFYLYDFPTAQQYGLAKCNSVTRNSVTALRECDASWGGAEVLYLCHHRCYSFEPVRHGLARCVQ